MPQDPTENRKDIQAMRRVRDGEIAALGELFERHHAALFRYFVRLSGNREFAEDAVQDVFHRILRYRHSYRGDGSFRAWMYQMARNVFVDLSLRQRPGGPEALDHLADEAPGPEAVSAEADRAALVRKAMDALTDAQREVLILSRYQDLRYPEIAEVLGCSVGAVKLRVHRAMRTLREQYSELSGGEA